MTDDLDTALFASDRAAHALSEDSATLRHDVHCILVECHRDRGATALRPDATGEAIAALSDLVARRLGPRIGGRYVPMRSSHDNLASRNEGIVRMFSGRNQADVMRHFSISRRVFYRVISDDAKRRRYAALK